MKYQININQLVLSDTELDLIDTAILDYLIFYCSSQSPRVESQRKTFDGKKYTWIDYATLIKDMPLLRIKSINPLTPRIKRIEQERYIEVHRESHQKLFVRLTERVDELFVKRDSSDAQAIRETGQSYHVSRTNNNTIDNYTNDKKEKPIGFLSTFLNSFNEKFQTNYQETDGRRKKIRLRLKKFSSDQLLSAIENLSQSKFHSGKNDRGWRADPDFLLRSDEQIDKWLNVKQNGESNLIRRPMLADLVREKQNAQSS